MKTRLVVLMLAAFTCCHAQGQIQKGMVLLGATTNLVGNLNQIGTGGMSNNVGIQFGKYKYKSGSFESEYTITAINLNPTAGVMATNNLMVGLSAGVFVLKTKDDDGDGEKLTSASFAPFIRAYLKNEGKTLPYLEVRGGINSMKYDDSDAETFPFLGAKFGGAIFLNSKLSLDLFLDYNYAKDKEDGSTTTQGLFGFGLGLSVFL